MRNLYYFFLMLLLFSSCSNPTQHNDPIPVHETFTIKSAQVNEDRTINVWVPENYKTSTDSLEVMYMPDGGIKEDFPHIANTLAQLVEEGKIDPLILVGIENTERRRDLTGPTEVAKDKEIAPVVGGSAKFRAFIKEELIPEINKRYRTTHRKTIIGESLAGLFVMETFFLDPDMFENYIAFDPSLWWNNSSLLNSAKEHLAKLPSDHKALWFAGSNAADISNNTHKLAEILEHTDTPNLDWGFAPEPNEEHSTIFRAKKEQAILWTLEKL